MNRDIQGDFQICISVPLRVKKYSFHELPFCFRNNMDFITVVFSQNISISARSGIRCAM